MKDEEIKMTIKKEYELNQEQFTEMSKKIKTLEEFINKEYEKKYFWKGEDSCTICCEDNTFKDGYQLALNVIGSLIGMNLEVSEKRSEEFIMKENNTANTSSTTTMTLDKALEICKERILIDRRMRENTPVEQFNDYEKFCEKECLAIETLINALECKKALDNVKQGYYNPKEHKPFVIKDDRVKEIREMLKSNKNMLLDDNVD